MIFNVKNVPLRVAVLLKNAQQANQDFVRLGVRAWGVWYLDANTALLAVGPTGPRLL